MGRDKAKLKAARPGAPSAGSGARLKLAADHHALDTTLTSLFATSIGPAQPRPRSATHQAPSEAAPQVEDGARRDQDDRDMPSVEDPLVREPVAAVQAERPRRKRRRMADEDEIEEAYMRRLRAEETRDDALRKAVWTEKRHTKGDDRSGVCEEAGGGSEVPRHERQASRCKDGDELDKASRTVFLGNISTAVISDKSEKKTLIKHMSSFLSELPDHTPAHKLESIRFRSTPFSTFIPKRAAYATRDVMPETAHSTNAYAIYSTQQAASEAARRLNGTVVLHRHLRVDVVAHPAKTDHRRCVFVGNLSFVDDESMIQEVDAKRLGNDGKKKKDQGPADVEEGLWRTFGKAGTVESVRVVRDARTRVGKGFAYVQFTDENAVEEALLYDDKRFPPMLSRKLRVTRAKAVKRNKTRSTGPSTRSVSGSGVHNPRISGAQKSFHGRAAKLLGKAGAARVRLIGARQDYKKVDASAIAPGAPEKLVFEGHRASEKQGSSGLSLGGKKGKRGRKPTSRSSKRGAAWKAAGGRRA